MNTETTGRESRGPRRATMTLGAFVVSATLAFGSGSVVAAPSVVVEQPPTLVAPAKPVPASTPEPRPTTVPEAAPASVPALPDSAAPTADAAPPVDDLDEAPDTIGPLERASVVLYGDSLAWEARDAFVTSFAGRADVTDRTFGGTAICDWLETMAADALGIQPGAVVVEFSGNSFTPCMFSADGAALRDGALIDRYRADAESVITMFVHSGTQVVFAGSPAAPPAAGRPALNDVYERLADEHDGVHYVDAGAAVLDEGRWTATLPCLAAEPCEGGVDDNGAPANAVRAPDGLHFCPAGTEALDGVTGTCSVWSSGAFRFGVAMAAPLVAALDAAS